MSRWSRCLQATRWQMVGDLTQPWSKPFLIIFPDWYRRIYTHQTSGCILHTILSVLAKKLHLAGWLRSELFLGWASRSLQDTFGFCKDQTSKLNRDMRETSLPASLRVALISAIPLQGYTVSDVTLSCWELGSLRRFCLAFPTIRALTNRSNVWVTPITTYINPNYILEGLGNEYQVSSETEWTQTLGKTLFITWPLCVCPHYNTEPGTKFWVFDYQYQLGPCVQQYLKCLKVSLSAVNTHAIHGLDPFGEALGKSLCITESFPLRPNHLFSHWAPGLKTEKWFRSRDWAKDFFGVTLFNLLLIHSCSVLTMYMKLCILAVQLFYPSRRCVLLTLP